MRLMVCFGIIAIMLVFPPIVISGDANAAVTGTVNHPSVKVYPTVVYIDGIPDQELRAPASTPMLELSRDGFFPPVLAVAAGTTVNFINSDSRTHSLFSPDAEKYDLGELKRSESKPYTFTEPGVYVQLCSKHSQHKAYVFVAKTPYFAVADEKGRFRIPDVPAGNWKLKVWNESLALDQLRQSQSITVAAAAENNVEVRVAPLPAVGKFWLELPPPGKAGLVERGAWLYRQRGCFLCHGEEGSGGIRNPNYVKGNIPALDTLAERLMLFDPEDVNLIVEQLERGRNLEALRDDPPVPRYEAFLAQYASVRDVIRKGNAAGKMHPKGPKPPLDMPRNKDASDEDIRALVAYLLSLQGSRRQP